MTQYKLNQKDRSYAGMSMRLAKILLLLASFVPLLHISCPSYREINNYHLLDHFIAQKADHHISRDHIKGLSVGFIDIDGHIYEGHFGNSSKSSLYKIASVTKVITGLAVMQLAEQGLLGLDDKICIHLPDLSLKKKGPGTMDITILDLIIHASGLTRDILHKAQGNCPFDQTEIIDHLNNYIQPLPSGYRHSYSNPGIELLGMIIESATGLTYEAYVHKNILRPLNMEDSSFDQAGFTCPGFTFMSGERYTEYPINYTAAGGLISSSRDMLNLMGMFLSEGKGLLTPESTQRMFLTHNDHIKLDTDIKKGISFFLEGLAPPLKGVLAYHGGGAVFYNSMLMMAPEYGIGVIVLCNTAGSYSIVDSFARKVLNKAILLKTGIRPVKEQFFAAPAFWSEKEMESIKGHYILYTNILIIDKNEEGYYAEISGKRYPIHFHEGGYFSYSDRFFLKTKDIHYERVLFMHGNNELVPIGRHEFTSFPVNDKWSKAIGRYKLIKPCIHGGMYFYQAIELTRKGEILYASLEPDDIIKKIYDITVSPNIIIDAISDTRAIMKGFGRYSGESIYLNEQKGELHFSGLRFKK